MTLGRDRASFNQGKNAQFDFSVEEEKIGAQTAKGPGAVCTKGETLETTEGNKVLRILWETYGAQTVVEWGVGVLDALQQAEVLQSGVHEGGVSGEAENRDQLDGDTPPRASVVAEWLLREMRKQSKRGCASQGRKPSEQFVRQPSETLQELSHKNSPSAKDLFDMWSKGEGLWLLQQALYTIQEIRKSSMGERTGGGGATTSVVRRLTPLE